MTMSMVSSLFLIEESSRQSVLAILGKGFMKVTISYAHSKNVVLQRMLMIRKIVKRIFGDEKIKCSLHQRTSFI